MSAPGLHLWHPFTQDGVDPAPLLRARRARSISRNTGWPADSGRDFVVVGESARPFASRDRGGDCRASRAAGACSVRGIFARARRRTCRAAGKIVPAPLRHVFFSDDGSTAVEVALKLAVQYWNNCGRPEKRRIVALENAYHGDTAGAMSVSDDSPFTAAFDSLRIPVLRTHAAFCAHCPVGLTRATCHIECLNKLEQLLSEQGHEIAAVIVEPLLQGAGGMIVHPEEFLAGVRRLTSAHDVLLIADEVLTGFGRTGRMFACERAGVVPDLMCVAKGLTGGFLPLAATFATDQIHEAFIGVDRTRAFFHGHSYTANPIACAAANASLQIFENEPVFERIAAIEQVHATRLPSFSRASVRLRCAAHRHRRGH